MKKYKSIFTHFMALLFITAGIIAQDIPPANDLYEQAMEAKEAKNWNKTSELLQDYVDNYENEQQYYNALYWLGISYQRTESDYPRAFSIYDQLLSAAEETKWHEEAITNQIYVAEQLARKGAAKYHDFLLEKMDSDDEAVRNEAALSLGKIGDERSIPVLKEITDDPQIGPLAQALIANMDPDAMPESELRADVRERQKDRAAEQRENNRDLADADEPDKNEDKPFLWFFKKNYAFYEEMLRAEDTWSQVDLMGYGMWVIVPASDYDEFYALEDDDAKMEWIKEEWKDVDPNPNTPENEALAEFERRVIYAYENYSDTWDYRQFKYLREQYQREGWPNAPWDARGDIYVKYGEPDFATIGNGLNWVEWTYFRFDVDFEIRKFMTNIYGNAIKPGPMTLQRFYSYFDYSQFEWEYVYNKEFYYP